MFEIFDSNRYYFYYNTFNQGVERIVENVTKSYMGRSINLANRNNNIEEYENIMIDAILATEGYISIEPMDIPIVFDGFCTHTDDTDVFDIYGINEEDYTCMRVKRGDKVFYVWEYNNYVHDDDSDDDPGETAEERARDNYHRANGDNVILDD
jgi:hypothetical protein